MVAADAQQLSHLRNGEVGFIHNITAAETTAKRLADLGFVRGGCVEMLRAGRPCLVRVGRTCIGLGRDLQQIIYVTRDHTETMPKTPPVTNGSNP